MKKINVLAIALLFTMTAKSDQTTASNQEIDSVLKEVCESRKDEDKCWENSTNFKEVVNCAEDVADNRDKNLSKKYNVNYEDFNADL